MARFGGSLRGGVPVKRVVPGSFGWLLLIVGDFEWFQMVCCFSSYTNSQHAEELFFYYTQERT